MFSVTHLLFDLLAYLVAALCTMMLIRRRRLLVIVPDRQRPMHLLAMAVGAIAGSLLFGTTNLLLLGQSMVIGKSIIGALVGGVIAVEWFKSLHGIRGSTGAVLVPGLALGIAIGRVGCFSAGLEDATHGIPTTSPLGVDFGDGVLRHPVQLYESATMALFGVIAGWRLWRDDRRWWQQGFYWLVMVYGLQRMIWEFLKPYPAVLGLTVFQWLCLALIGYGLVMLRKQQWSSHVDQPA